MPAVSWRSVHVRLSHRLPIRLSLCISLCETLVPSSPLPLRALVPWVAQERPGHCQLEPQGPPRPNTTSASSRRSSHRLPWNAHPPPLQVRGLQLTSSPRSPFTPTCSSLPPWSSVPSSGSGAPAAQQCYFRIHGRHLSSSNGLQAPRALGGFLQASSSFHVLRWAQPLSLSSVAAVLPWPSRGGGWAETTVEALEAARPSDLLIAGMLVAQMCLGQTA